ncbi:hypothetical protein V8C35DRAFT_175362 [Trichoderma chlorosporum]
MPFPSCPTAGSASSSISLVWLSLSIARACGRIVENEDGHFIFPFVFLRLSSCPNFQTPRISLWSRRETDRGGSRTEGSEKTSLCCLFCCLLFRILTEHGAPRGICYGAVARNNRTRASPSTRAPGWRTWLGSC